MKTKKELREFLIKNLWFVETSEPWDGYLCKKCWRMVFDPDCKHRNLNRETCDSDEIIHVREVTEQEPINTDLEVLKKYVEENIEYTKGCVDTPFRNGSIEAYEIVLERIKSLMRWE